MTREPPLNCVGVTFGLIFFGAIFGAIPRPTIVALAAIPLAFPVYHGLKDFYDSPYQLMPKMGTNIQLHMATGMLLILGYVVAIVASHVSSHPPFFLR